MKNLKPKYKVQRELIGGTWEDAFFDEMVDANGYGKQIVALFDSKEDAEKEIREHTEEVKDAINRGHMRSHCLEQRDEFRIVKVIVN